MTLSLYMIGFAFGGMMTAYILHLVVIVINEVYDHYLIRLIEHLPKFVPDGILFIIGLGIAIGGIVLFSIALTLAINGQGVAVLASYGFGIMVYFALVPFRITLLPSILEQMFPGRRSE